MSRTVLTHTAISVHHTGSFTLKRAMEDSVLLLVLLLSLKASSLPYRANATNCSGPYKYIKEGSGLCCNRCPPGHKLKTECTETHDSVCEPCRAEQYMEGWNYAKNCLSCVRCVEDKGLQYTKRCSSTSKAKCGCLPGRYCYMGNRRGCQECVLHKTCEEGSGVSVPGTNTSDVWCEKCLDGTFSDTVSSTDTCRPHTFCDERDIISKGNATSDTVCKSVVSTQINATFDTRQEASIISTEANPPRKETAVQPKTLPMSTKSGIITGILLISTTKMPNLTKNETESGSDKPLAAVIGCVAGMFLLIVAIVVLALCKRGSRKPDLEDHAKVDANGNCETNSDNANHCYLGDISHLSVNNVQPEQQCLLQNGTVSQNHWFNNVYDHNSHESLKPLQSTLPLHQPECALSEPLPLQSNMDQNVSAAQPSSQPTSPQNVTPSPLVNVNINLHIGNGSCGSSTVMLKDMPPAEPKIPFGEEEESYCLLQQEDGKPSLLSVEESRIFQDTLCKTQDEFV